MGHEKTPLNPRYVTIAFAIFIGLFVTTAGSIAQANSTTTFSGQASVLQVTVPPLSPITVVDTGPLPSSGGAQEASLLDVPAVSLGSAGAVNGADVAHAATVGQGNGSKSQASVADLSLTAAGNTIAADFLMSEATAQCQGANPSVSGRSELASVVINGQRIGISGATNQTIQLPLDAGSVVINEQSSSVNGRSGSMDVNALHVVANNPAGGPALADVIVSHVHADVTCPASPAATPVCGSGTTDFVTGGGWIVSPSDPKAKAHFAVAGGIKNGPWGHLLFVDHGNGLRAKGTGVTGYDLYAPFGPNGRQTRGSADVAGTTDSYEADVADDGEPGSTVDRFQLLLNGAPVASDSLAGGNIQLHKPVCR
ncbi:MAG: choice-of-anchor P family protein [Myxococcales bacterium]